MMCITIRKLRSASISSHIISILVSLVLCFELHSVTFRFQKRTPGGRRLGLERIGDNLHRRREVEVGFFKVERRLGTDRKLESKWIEMVRSVGR